MKIVVLDGFTAAQDDLSWQELEALGDLTVYERTRPEETLLRCQGAEAVLTNKVILSAEIIRQLPHLKYIGVLATGYNVVDLTTAHERGIIVTNIPAYSTMSVAQMVFAHILNATGLLLDGYARGRARRQDAGHHRIGQHRFCRSPHSRCFRDARHRFHFQGAGAVARLYK